MNRTIVVDPEFDDIFKLGLQEKLDHVDTCVDDFVVNIDLRELIEKHLVLIKSLERRVDNSIDSSIRLTLINHISSIKDTTIRMLKILDNYYKINPI